MFSKNDSAPYNPERLIWRTHEHLEGEHTFTKTGRQRRPTYATVSTVVRAFPKAGIITQLPGISSDTDSDNDEGEPGMLDAVLAQLLIRTLK